jgi:hypothetical protein
MSIENKLITDGSKLSKVNGGENKQMKGSLSTSKLHFDYSINGPSPNIADKPIPSSLDKGGVKPRNSYDNTAPTEGIGRI